MVKKEQNRVKRAGAKKREEYKEASVLAKKHSVEPLLWGNDVADEIAKYIEWHAQHPHCASPRLVTTEEDLRGKGEMIYDEEKEDHVYFYQKPQVPVYEPQFYPTKLGSDANFISVSNTIVEQEFELRLQNLELEDDQDTWYDQSVKDHYQDEHLVTKSRYAPTQSRQLTDHPLRHTPPETFIDCVARPENQENLKRLAIKESLERQGKIQKVKINPFKDPYVFSKITKSGTLLDPFDQVELEKNVTEAMTIYREEETSMFTTKAGGPEDVYTVMAGKLGSHDVLEKMSAEWIKYSLKVRKMAKRKGPLFETSMDLIDSCNRLNHRKVKLILMTGANPRIKVEDDSLFIHMIGKAVQMDVSQSSLGVGDREEDERKNLQKIIDSMISAGVDINERSTAGFAPIHLAAIKGDSKVVRMLINNKADPRLKSKEGMSALMYAGKYGHVYVMAEYIKLAGLKSLEDTDLEGRNVLHYCGANGQTRAAMFLIRVGADKKTRDLLGDTPGSLAMAGGYFTTAQEILGFSRSPTRAKVALQYLVDVHYQPKTLSDSILGSLSAGWAAMGSLVSDAGNAMKDMFSGMFGRKAKGDIRIQPGEYSQSAVHSFDAIPETEVHD